MKRPVKKWLSLILASLMLLSTAACGQTATPATESTTAAAAAATTKAAGETTAAAPAGIDTSEHQSITFVVLGNKPTNGRMEAAMEKINALMTEKINADLTLQYVEWADWQTQYNLLLASGDSSLDLIGTATDWLNAWENTKRGSFAPLSDELLSTYAPQTWAAVPADHWEQCKHEGSIYFIPEDQYTQWTNHGVFYRGDWAKEAGLTTVASFEDLEVYFDGVLKNHPDVVPWDAAGSTNLGGLASGYINAYTDNFVINGVTTGIFAPYYVTPADPYKVVSPFLEGDTLVKYATLMKTWADKGFWREDVLNYTGDTRELFYAGQSGADQHHTQTFVTQIRTNMDKKQPGSEASFYSFSETSKNLVRDIITHGACAISSASKHVERALMVYDLLRNDEEIYRLYNYGIEGEDYLLTADGKMARPEGWDSSKMSLDTNFWYGRNDALQLDDSTHYAGKADIYKAYDTYAIEYPLNKFVFDPANVQTQMASLADVFATYMPKIAWGQTEDPAAEVEAFRKALNDAGFQEMMAEVQKQLDAVKAAQ